MKFYKKYLNCIFILSGFSFLFTIILSQDVLSQENISEYQERLTKISKQIEELQAKITEEDQKKSNILSQLGKIGIEKRLIRKEISLYNTQLEKANLELSSTQENISHLKEKLNAEKQSIQKTLVTLYKFGKFNSLQFMLQAEDVGSLISEMKHLKVLAQHQEKIITDYLTTLMELKTAEEELEAKKKEITD